jgi:RNA polymerase sigma-70 factor (ECF subfamily)
MVQAEDLEQTIRSRCEQGDWEAAATAALRGYGPQILGVLASLHRDEADAAEAFSIFSEDLWRGLRLFRWECSFRTWAYTVARNASQRHGKDQRRRKVRQVSLSDCPELLVLAEKVRTETLTYLRTETKTRVHELRQELSEEDRTVLILRVDRRLSWLDLARVMLGDEPVGDDALRREAARVRKRFQLIKERLIARMAELGILPSRAEDEASSGEPARESSERPPPKARAGVRRRS